MGKDEDLVTDFKNCKELYVCELAAIITLLGNKEADSILRSNLDRYLWCAGIIGTTISKENVSTILI
jgi:hypothetical protein